MPTPARTSTAEIVTAARSTLEAEGLEGMTMHRVAEAVGVRPPSLYKRVRGRGDLIRLVAEDIARQLAESMDRATSGHDPARDLRSIAHAFRAFAHANPRAYALIFAQLPDESRVGSDALAAGTAALLRATADLAGKDAQLEAARTVVAWAHGFVSMELAGAFRMGGSVDDAFSFGIDRITAALAQGGAR
jgi:AcrR family transcriptional regulator